MQAFDGNAATKWLAFFGSARSTAAWLEYRQPGSAPAAVLSYVLTSANDFPERDPGDWVLHGLPADAQAGNPGAHRCLAITWITLGLTNTEVDAHNMSILYAAACTWL